MKIIRFNCCSMDVHKNSVVATIGITDKNTQITQYIQEMFSTLNTDLLRLKQWLIDHDCFDVCMESTVNTGFLSLRFCWRIQLKFI